MNRSDVHDLKAATRRGVFVFALFALGCVSGQADAVVDGANFNASAIVNTYHVDIHGSTSPGTTGSEGDPFGSIESAILRARNDLDAGIGARVLIHPGTYRQSMGSHLWVNSSANRKNTPLLIEGSGPGVVISGADVMTGWQYEGNGVYSTPWTHNIGNDTYWQAGYAPDDSVLAHRAEQVIVNGSALRPALIEQYDFANDGSGQSRWTYTGVVNPTTTLQPGQFGVAERSDHAWGDRLYVRLPENANPADALVEASTRSKLFEMNGKDQIAFRNLTFQHAANHVTRTSGGQDREGVIIFDGFQSNPNSLSSNILFDGVTSRWNSAEGIRIENVSGVTVRNSHFDYNGSQGFSLQKASDVVYESNTANYNNWRDGALGGQPGWYTGGMKWASMEGVRIRDLEVIGNVGAGLWFDIDVQDVVIEDLVSVYNTRNLFLEISQGPFTIERALLAMPDEGDASVRSLMAEDVTISDSIILGGPDRNSDAVYFVSYGRGRSNVTGEFYRPGPLTVEDSIVYGEGEAAAVNNHNQFNASTYPDLWAAAQHGWTGIGNTYFAENPDKAFAWRKNSGFNYGEGTLEEWLAFLATNGSEEIDPTFADPRFQDMARLVFLPAEDSPFYGNEGDLPFMDLSGYTAELAAFYAWAGVNRDVLVTIPPIPGDANESGKVDLLDLSILASSYNRPGLYTWSDGDFNGDQRVDLLDLSILASHFGERRTFSSSSDPTIPAPSSLSVLVLSGCAIRRQPSRQRC
ncbi:right-handed parallel beta-helix repeat-containing protein [Mucisphaera calidilacus]|uniref:Probable pectate lyase C n=1 Tax=Mucisphaera calidilacus TaxID=2527982 RepID=A0A518BX01_9BACT|nr:right-handed parallel beta-helix repeat-containing protein [Mucisphaera calidilacus]QDU71496.1 hypothetical protein Pan265_13460 [Mucisphaera calidilacus]